MRKALQRQSHQSQTPTQELSPQTARASAPEHSFGFSEIDIFPKSGQHTSGTGIAEGLRAQMEASFQSDFSSLKIFEDHSASQIHAKAYAQGEHLYFAPGRYDPSSQAGLELLGHELAHVVQQRQGIAPDPLATMGLPSSLPWSRINTDRTLEHEADTLGRQAARGERASVAPRSGGALSVTGAPVIQASPEDETRLHKDIEARANSVWQSHGSPQGQDQFAQTTDWNTAQGQQKSEIERRANLEYHKRFTADPVTNDVSAPAHSDEKMVADYGKAEESFKRELRNRERAAKPTNTSGVALSSSGEFDNIGQSGTAATVTDINQRTPDPSNPGKLSDTRKNILQAQLDLSGRTNSALPTPKIAPIDSSLKTENPTDYKTDLEFLGRKRQSGIQESVVQKHLSTYLEANSDDTKSATGHAPLGHAHSAHGFDIPAVQQIERQLYGIRPDERGEGADNFLKTSNTPNGTVNLPNGMTGLANKGKDSVEQTEFDSITDVSSFPQITAVQAAVNPNYNPAIIGSQPTLSGNALKGRKGDLGVEIGKGGTASGFTSALAEYNSLNQNFAQAWQSKDEPNFTPGQNVAVTSQNVGNPVGSTHSNAAHWKPEEYGRGFKYDATANPPKLKRADADLTREANTVSRAEAITVERQNSSKTVVKKLLDGHGHMNGFDVTTNFPNNDLEGVNKKVGNATVNVDSTFQPQQTNAQNEDTELATSLARIGTSTTGNIPYWRDVFGDFVTDPTTGNPSPELDSNGKPIKQGF